MLCWRWNKKKERNENVDYISPTEDSQEVIVFLTVL
jgi:hypothetical protein